MPHLAKFFQEREVLHVAGSDLQYVGVFGDQPYVLDVDDLGDDRNAKIRLDLSQHLQSVPFQPLEAEGRGARLEGTAPDHRSPEFLYRLGRLHKLLLTLHGARSGHDYHSLSPDLDAGHIYFTWPRMEFS
ncbi:hypothetical protein ES703_74579 [subsurface metagenome]